MPVPIYTAWGLLYTTFFPAESRKNPLRPVTPITSLGLPYSQALLEVVERMMQPDPNRRYQTAAELLRVFCDLRKLDKRYTHHRAAQHTVTVVFSALWWALCSFLFSDIGRWVWKKKSDMVSW